MIPIVHRAEVTELEPPVFLPPPQPWLVAAESNYEIIFNTANTTTRGRVDA